MDNSDLEKFFGKAVMQPDELKADLGEDLNDHTINSAATQNGISDTQRFILKNIFDTQPKKRAAYFKQLGYEMNPKDPEEYRPAGSDAEYGNIEPQGSKYQIDMFGLFQIPNPFTEEGRAEFVKDLKDISFDLAIDGPAQGTAGVAAAGVGATAGASAAGAIGGLAGPVGAGVGATAGATAGGFAGMFAGAASAKAAVEGFKNVISDYFLDAEVPMDLKETFFQSMSSGLAAGGGKVVGNLFKRYKQMGAKSALKSLKEVTVRRANGNFNDNMMKEVIENPQNFTPEKVEGAKKTLNNMFKRLFGTTEKNPHTTKKLTGGLLAKPMKKLNEQADLEIERLSKEPMANFDFEELANIALDSTKEIRANRFPSNNARKAVDFLKMELQQIRKQSTRKLVRRLDPATGEMQVFEDEVLDISFKEGRDILKRWQNAAFEEGPLKDNPVLKKVTAHFKKSADLKAESLGSPLRKINEDRSELLSFYGNMRKSITKGRFQNAYIGRDSIQKQEVVDMFGVLDDKLGTDLAVEVSSTQYQAAMETLFKNPTSFGSGAVIPDALKGGGKEAVKSAFAFATIGSSVGGTSGAVLGAKIGAAKGFVKGAVDATSFSSPERLMKSFIKRTNKVDKIANSLIDPKSLSEIVRRGAIEAGTVGGAAGREVTGQLQDSFQQAEQPQPAQQPQAAAQPQPGQADQADQGNAELEALFGKAAMSPEELKADLGL